MPLYTCLLTWQCPSTSKVNENPASSASWCKYQKDKANHTNLFKYGPGLPLAVIVKLKLNIPNLVRKLAAEVLAWQDVKSKWVFEWDGVTKDSKEIYIERKMELELHNAISNFDIGAVTIIKLFQALGIPSSKYTQEACRLQDQHRVDIVQLTSKSSTRRRCQVIRALKKEKDDQNKQTKGFNYGPGQFWTVQFLETILKSWKKSV